VTVEPGRSGHPVRVHCTVKLRRWAPPGRPQSWGEETNLELGPGQRLLIGARDVQLPAQYEKLWPAEDGGTVHRIQLERTDLGLEDWDVRALDDVPAVLVDVHNDVELTVGVGAHRVFVPDGASWRLRVDGADVDDATPRALDPGRPHDVELLRRNAEGHEHVFARLGLLSRAAVRPSRWADRPRPLGTREPHERRVARHDVWRRIYGAGKGKALPLPFFVVAEDSWLRVLSVTAALVREGVPAGDLVAAVVERLPAVRSNQAVSERWRTLTDRKPPAKPHAKLYPDVAGLPEPMSGRDPFRVLCGERRALALWQDCQAGRAPKPQTIAALCAALDGPRADFFPGLADLADKSAFEAWHARRSKEWWSA
jgi:hypothetical protein